MSDTKHTTGPWHEGSHRTVESQNGTICEVYSHMGIEEADANQKLIAAAPELLEALNQQLYFLNVLSGTVPLHEEPTHRRIKLQQEELRAAIAKATGGAA